MTGRSQDREDVGLTQSSLLGTNVVNITDLSDTYTNFHEYEIDWTPDKITWSVDGVAGRTLKRTDTWNATTNQWDYPQTPARVELSIWPGGASSNSMYTIQWAGGAIDWDSQDIKDYGYDFATFSSVTIECYNASSGLGTNKGKSYYYDNVSGLNNSVVNGDNATILASFLGTGTDMDAGADSSASASSSTSTADTVPGNSGSVGNAVGAGDDSSSGGSGSGGGSSTSSSTDCATTGFVQSCGSDGDSGSSKKSGAAGGGEAVFGTGASAFAAVVAFVFLMWL